MVLLCGATVIPIDLLRILKHQDRRAENAEVAQSEAMVYGTRIEKGAANPLSIGFQLNTRKLHLEEGNRRLEMNGLVLFPATAEHCLVARVGYRMMTIGMSIGAARGLIATLLLLSAGLVSASAQTPT